MCLQGYRHKRLEVEAWRPHVKSLIALKSFVNGKVAINAPKTIKLIVFGHLFAKGAPTC